MDERTMLKARSALATLAGFLLELESSESSFDDFFLSAGAPFLGAALAGAFDDFLSTGAAFLSPFLGATLAGASDEESSSESETTVFEALAGFEVAVLPALAEPLPALGAGATLDSDEAYEEAADSESDSWFFRFSSSEGAESELLSSTGRLVCFEFFVLEGMSEMKCKSLLSGKSKGNREDIFRNHFFLRHIGTSHFPEIQMGTNTKIF